MEEETTSSNFIKKIEQYINGEINEVDLYNFVTDLYDQTKKWTLELSKNQNSFVDMLYQQMKQIEVVDSNLTFIMCYLKYLYLYNGIKRNTLVRNNKYKSEIKDLESLCCTIKTETNVNEIYINSLKELIFYKDINSTLSNINDFIAKKNFKIAYNKLIYITYNLHNDLRGDYRIKKPFILLQNECLTDILSTLDKELYYITLKNIEVLNDVLVIINFITGYNNDLYRYKKKLFFKNSDVSFYSYCLMKFYRPSFSIVDNQILNILLKDFNSYFEKRLSLEECTENEKQTYILSKNKYAYWPNLNNQEIINFMTNKISFYESDFEYLKLDKDNKSHIDSLEYFVIKSHFISHTKTFTDNFISKYVNLIEYNYHHKMYIKTVQLFENYIYDAPNVKIETKQYAIYLNCLLLSINEKHESIKDSELYKYYLNYVELNKGQYKNTSRKLYLYHVSYEFDFGKYKSQYISDILKTDPQYILWCIINLNKFIIEGISFDLFKTNENNLLYEAIKHNLTKLMIYELFEEPYEPHDDYDNDNYNWEDSYYDGGGGDEWSDPSQF